MRLWRALLCSGLALISTAVRADMYQNAGNAELPAAQVNLGIPLAVDSNAALKGFMPPAQGANMLRRGFYAAGDAPAFQYRYSNTPCSMNVGNGDDGAQVKAADGKCWLAQIAAAEVDVRQWGARSDNGITDNGAIIVKALAAAAGRYCIMVPQDGTNYYAIKTTITLPTGSNHCLKSTRQWPRLFQPNGTNLSSMITATGATGILLENLELDGNGDNNTSPAGGEGNLINLQDVNTTDVTLNNLYVHHSPGHGAIVAGSGIHINGGYYSSNGRVPSTGTGSGVVIGSGGHNFQINGVTAGGNATSGIGCAGTCYSGVINGNIGYNNGAGVYPVIADNFTGYSSDIYNLIISNNLSYGGGNNGIHFGGNRISYTGNIVHAPAFYGIAHRSAKAYRTGTVTCNGTGAIVGVGTAWADQFPYNLFTADNLSITIRGITSNVVRVSDNTNLLLYTDTCATGSALPYTLNGYTTTTDVTISGNTVTGTVPPNGAFWVDMVNGGTITGNTSTTGDGDGLMLRGSRNINISGNNFSNKPGGSAVWLNPHAYHAAGTVAVTNGSAAVVGTGTGFLTGASPWNGSSVFMVAGDITNYAVTAVADNTHLTLDRPFTGATSGSKAYAIATGLNTHNLISGNVLTNNLVGVLAKGSSYNTISGNHISCTLAAATCDTYTGVLGTGNVEFADAILGNNFPRMRFWQQVDNVNNSVGLNARDLTPLGPILPKNCTLQMSGAMYNNAGAFAICP